jgi:3-oxoacyl-[acyl-carrier-protein] synthase II
MTRIPISGIGVVAPGAIGIDAFRAQLDSGRTAIETIDRFDTAGLRAHKGALIRDFTPKDFINPMKMRRMNTLSRYAMAAAKLAMRDATLDSPDLATGVALGTAFGPVQTSVDYMQEYVEKGATLAPPQLFAESVANAPGSHIAIEHSLRGFNVTITQRESSALAATMYAASQIAKGAAPAALAGGIEETNEMIYSVLDRVGALAHAQGGEDEAVRPFDRRRNGLLPGEGSAILVLNGRSAAYGYVSGFGIARDTSASISDWGNDAAAVVAAMRAAVEDAGLAPHDISAIYASANSTVRADDLERRAIESMFQNRVPVIATKGVFGEYAAGGALVLAAAALAIRDQTLHGSAGFESGDDGMRMDVTRTHRAADVRHVLVNSISAGGGIVCAVLSREAQ